MQILDREIPAELVHMITHELVCDGLKEAWKLRGICSVFPDAIEEDILLRQPSDHLKTGGDITDNLAPRYLAERVRRPNLADVQQAVPNEVRKLHAFLCNDLHADGEKEKAEILQRLCDGMVKIREPIMILGTLWGGFLQFDGVEWLERDTAERPLTLYKKIFAATAVGAYDPVRGLLLLLTEYKFPHREGPLFLRVKLGDEDLLSISFDHLASLKNPLVSADATRDFGAMAALDEALKRKGFETIEKLFTALQHPPTPNNSTHKRWREAVVDAGNAELVKHVLGSCANGIRKVDTAAFTRACEGGNVEVVRALLKEGEMKPLCNYGASNIMPLNVAIRTGTTEIVSARSTSSDLPLQLLEGGNTSHSAILDLPFSRTQESLDIKAPTNLQPFFRLSSMPGQMSTLTHTETPHPKRDKSRLETDKIERERDCDNSALWEDER
jgi:hypothetical protein